MIDIEDEARRETVAIVRAFACCSQMESPQMSTEPQTFPEDEIDTTPPATPPEPPADGEPDHEQLIVDQIGEATAG
jgi:hypothetical protein